MMTHQRLILSATMILGPAAPLPQQEPPFERLVNAFILLVALIFVVICLAALIVALTALLPKVSERSRAALVQSPWRAFLIGLANYLFLGGISLVLASTEVDVLGLIALLIITGLAVVTLLGLPGLVLRIGEGLAELHSGRISALRQLLWGTITFELAALLPIAGWFLFAPVGLMISFGAAVLAWRSRKQVDPFFSEEIG